MTNEAESESVNIVQAVNMVHAEISARHERSNLCTRELELLNEPFRSQIFLCTRTNLISRCWLVESLVVSVRPTPSVRVELSNYVKSISIDPGSPLSRSNSPNPPNSGFSGICHSVSVFPNPSHLGRDRELRQTYRAILWPPIIERCPTLPCDPIHPRPPPLLSSNDRGGQTPLERF